MARNMNVQTWYCVVWSATLCYCVVLRGMVCYVVLLRGIVWYGFEARNMNVQIY